MRPEFVDLKRRRPLILVDEVQPSDVLAELAELGDVIMRTPASGVRGGSISRSVRVKPDSEAVFDVACVDLLFLLNESVAATGLSHGEVRDLYAAEVRKRHVLVIDGVDELVPADNRASEPWQSLVRARAILKAFLLQLIKLGRRSSAARQSAAERARLASRSAAASSDRPPAGTVLLSTRAPRGPNAPRTASTQVIGGEQVAAA